MSDIADDAQPESDQLLDYGLAAHRRRQIAESALPINWRGLCHDCDEYIAPDRLEANPRVFRCFGCQTALEARERRA
ncbi:TraR/DksA C4-type zinc finger protein [Salinisphaera orenii]|uniref:Zinc finger DksA/TraR C4-type domain-containing protein n=1 Tax=Salinisphaera orenii YIM 95161 TaxID=1051139 RepID=A0A423PRP2_9GAMM|nr:TraR/DksA C4-type zinc finger protein [Salinisphaera halophila]ROO28275.1 hypothetical protein SAHL_10775 [Salinisphaera halophila YIM 95161]